MSTLTKALTATLARRDADELTAAREEQREACAQRIEGVHRRSDGNCEDRFKAQQAAGGTMVASFGSTCGNCSRAEMVRATPLTATPLAERIKALEEALGSEESRLALAEPLARRVLEGAEADLYLHGPGPSGGYEKRVATAKALLGAVFTPFTATWLERHDAEVTRALRADLAHALGVRDAAMEAETKAETERDTLRAQLDRCQTKLGEVLINDETDALLAQLETVRAQRDAAVEALGDIVEAFDQQVAEYLR